MKKTIGLFAIAALLLSACNRNDEDIISEEDEKETEALQAIAADQALAQTFWDDIGDQVDGSTANAEAGFSVWNSCAVLTIDTMGNPFPLTITLDFDTGCVGRDGRIRRGKIIYELSGPYREAGSSTETSTDEYYVNDHKILGKRSATNNGENSSGQLTYEITVSNATIIDPEGETVKWSSTRTRTWVEGQETGFFTPSGNGILGWEGITDDVYEISGDGIGVSKDGYTFDVTIDTPLRVQLDCRYITEGVVRIIPEEFSERTLDYGDGTCDDKAVVETALGVREVTLGGGGE